MKSMPVPPADVRFRIGLNQKLKEAIGWEPKYGIDFIIDDTYKYVATRSRNRAVS